MRAEPNWFWQQGYRDGFAGRSASVPDKWHRLWDRNDYYAGYDAGDEERAAKAEAESDEE